MHCQRSPLLSGRSALLVAFATILYTLSLPPFELDLLAFLVGLPLALLVVDPRRPLAAREAWIAGLLFGEATTLAVGGHWLYLAAHDFFGKPPWFSAAFTLVTTLTHAGLFIGAAVAVSARLAKLRSPTFRILGFAGTWVSFELLRARILYGCPWDFLGHALYRRPALMQTAALGGAYALSFACLATGALCASVLQAETRRRRLVSLGLALALPAAMALAGRSLDGSAITRGSERKPPLVVGLVQAAIGRHELWDPTRRTDHLDRLLELSRSPELDGADLIVWAENAVPFLLDADADAQARIEALARETGAYILTGAPRAEDRGDGQARFYNSVYLFAPDGAPYRTYDKIRLLPYVEGTPRWARGWLPRTRGIEYEAGQGNALFEVRGWKIAPLICFESTYPEITRQLATLGADLLVNVSNDSWFDRGAAPAQHFAMTTMRAVETGLPIVRVANTGVSAVVARDGRLVLELPVKRPAVATFRIAPRSNRRTPYTAIGDTFAWVCVVIAVAARARSRAIDSGAEIAGNATTTSPTIGSPLP